MIIVLVGLGQVNTYPQSTQKQVIKVPKATMELYVGSYETKKDTFLKIQIDGEDLKLLDPYNKPFDLVPITTSRFFLKAFGVDVAFVKNDNGKITKLLMIWENGQQKVATRVER